MRLAKDITTPKVKKERRKACAGTIHALNEKKSLKRSHGMGKARKVTNEERT